MITKKEILECRVNSLGLSDLMKKSMWKEIDDYAEEVAEAKAGQHETIVICDGCNVKGVWEHRCFGEGCGCDEPVCMERQGRITHEELMEIVNKHLESK